VVLNLAIGQGENQQTLLRQAVFYAALATGESPVVPHLVRNELLERRRAAWALDLPEPRRRELVEALTRVVNEPGGTGYFAALDRWTLAGKTGTAQNPHGEPHSWFIGFAPAQDPKIVIASIVEFGHPDNTLSLAVPFASRLVQRYLDAEGVPPEPTRVAGTAR
jgi:penicillin-binding protein 2